MSVGRSARVAAMGDDGGEPATGDSFWDIGQYKQNVKRINDGHAACASLSEMVRERGEIESSYAKQLSAWGAKWSQTIERSAEPPAAKSAWQAAMIEADERAKLHVRIKQRLTEEVLNTMKLWSRENYHPKALTGIKEAKDIEECFKKAQKPWAKQYAKMDKCKKEYHQACKAERTAYHQDKNAQGDSSIAPDTARKLREKLERSQEEKDKTEKAYKQALQELDALNGRYMEDMTVVFENGQKIEEKRLKFFKEMLLGVHKCLDPSQDNKLTSIYRDYAYKIGQSKVDEDLEWWAENHGVGMKMKWPAFQEYSPESRAITGKKPPANGETGAVVLVGQKPVDDESTSNVSIGPNRLRQTSSPYRAGNENSNGGSRYAGGRSAMPMQPPAAINASDRRDSNGHHHTFNDDDDWDAGNSDLYEHSTPVRVRALYDYLPVEPDEIALTKGDIFEKLVDEDDQGWCTGRKDGRVGLYPANYAIAI